MYIVPESLAATTIFNICHHISLLCNFIDQQFSGNAKQATKIHRYNSLAAEKKQCH